MHHEALQDVERGRRKRNALTYIDPFEQKNFLERRIGEGYYGPTASFDRSTTFEQKSTHFVGQIKDNMARWKSLYDSDARTAHIEREKQLIKLEEEWGVITKGGVEEQNWTASAVATVASSFEFYMGQQDGPFTFFDNQLYYMSVMTLDEGKYDFGELTTHNRGVQLDTGEGKTKCSGVLAGVLSLKKQPVHIIEQNYLSALEHANEMAPFLEQFLHIETGAVVDLTSKTKVNIKKYFDDKGLLHIEPEMGTVRESYVCLGGKLKNTSRDYAWRRQIVYTDTNSLSTDRTLDSRITVSDKSGIPPLGKAIALIQEGDDIMIDRAQSPSVIDRTISGKEGRRQYEAVWDTIADHFFHVWEGKPVSKKEKRVIAQQLVFGVWANLELLNQSQKIFKSGADDATYAVTQGGVVMKDELLSKVEENIVPELSGLFGSLEEAKRYFRTNSHILQSATQIFLGHKPDIGYISGEEPVLMDQYGVPLDKRQLRDLEHVFLQMNNIWQKEGMSGKRFDLDTLEKIMDKNVSMFSVSQGTVARKYPSTIFKEYGTLRATSGSLLPVSETMENIYGMETLGVQRHIPIKEQVYDKSEAKLITKCLDGGEAEVQFVDEKDRGVLIAEHILRLQREGRTALIIMPNAIEAKNLFSEVEAWIANKNLSKGKNRMQEIDLLLAKLKTISTQDSTYINHSPDSEATRQAEALQQVLSTLQRLSLDETTTEEEHLNGRMNVITGKEELSKRGTLSEQMSIVTAQDIIITTSMAHRDINPHLSEELIRNGGIEVIVCGAANERGLWQALQRSIRSDVPGSRRLILTEKDIYPVSHSLLLNSDPLPSPFMSRKEMHIEKVSRYKQLWKKSNLGDMTAKTDMYKAYLGELRMREDRERISLLYSTAREEHVDLIQKAFINKLKSTQWWGQYLDRQTKQWFYPSQKKRFTIIPFADVEYIHNYQITEAFVQETYWSEMLDNIDFESVRFGIENLEAQRAPTIIDYQHLWDLHMYQYIDNMRIREPKSVGL